jgi:ubiquinone/menaquinone biosynthesis C-methylase UbiE
MQNSNYVHGYSEREATRLADQANTLDELIHHDTIFPAGSQVLEAGCGVGAQTKIIATKNPDSRFISVDISMESLLEAEQLVKSLGIQNVRFQPSDIYSLPYPDETFDHVLVCFVLEHLNNPINALTELKRVLKKDGTLVVIEGDHGSTFFYPDSHYAHLAIECQIQIQKQVGGNANIGRELFPLLKSAGFEQITVSPRMVYVDASRPHLVEGFIKNTFTAMIEGVEKQAIKQGIIDPVLFKKGIEDLYRTAQSDGVFNYTFFKGVGKKE